MFLMKFHKGGKKMNRDELRSKLLAQSGNPIEVIEFKGIKVDFLRPTLKQRADIARSNEKDTFGFIFSIIKECCRVPGTSERIFEDADREAFDNCQSGTFFDHMLTKVERLVSPNIEEDIEKK